MTIEITPTMTWDQFKEMVLMVRKATKGRPVSIAEAKATLLLEIEKVRRADKKEARIWSGYVREVFKPKSSKPNQLESKTNLTLTPIKKEKVPGGPPDSFTGTPPKLLEATQLMKELMFEPDPEALPILAGTVASHLLGEAPVMQVVLAPPSGGKTEHIMAFARIPEFELISTMTENTFLSAYDPKDLPEGAPEPSLLLRHPSPILAVKDLNTIISRNYHQAGGIVGQFMELADGEMKKSAGNGREVYWKGHATAMIGVTPHFYNLYDMMSKLGPRFLFTHLIQPSSEAQALKAAQDVAQGRVLMERIQDCIAEWYYELEVYQPILTDEMKVWLAHLGNLVSLVRSMVDRNKDGEVQSVQEREEPGRIVKSFRAQAKGIARGYRREYVGTIEKGLLLRNGLDSLTPARQHILKRLNKFPGIGEADIAKDSPISRHLIGKALEDMVVLNILDDKGVTGAQAYSLHPQVKDLLGKVLA